MQGLACLSLYQGRVGITFAIDNYKVFRMACWNQQATDTHAKQNACGNASCHAEYGAQGSFTACACYFLAMTMLFRFLVQIDKKWSVYSQSGRNFFVGEEPAQGTLFLAGGVPVEVFFYEFINLSHILFLLSWVMFR